MNAEQLLAHFDRISDSPESIPRLRKFILDLAIRGKLIEQDSSDSPVAELLGSIENEKARLSKEGRIRGKIEIVPLDATAGTHAIPSSWTWVRFGDIMFSRDWERVPVSQKERSTRAKIYDYYGASGVIDKIDGFLFDKPLLLIGEDGANLLNRSTPIAYIARGKYWVNNHAHVLDGVSEEFLRFIELYVNAIDLKPYVTGTAQPKMNQAKMNSIPIALPPLAEQHRIVAKVDELMGLCDRLEAAQQEREACRTRLTAASLARLSQPADAPQFRDHVRFHLQHFPRFTTRPDQIPQLRQTILNLAVRGRLVPQDANEGAGTALMERIRTEKAWQIKSGMLRTQQPLAGVDDAAKPFKLPASWCWTRVDDCFAVAGGIQKTPARIPKDNPHPYIGVGNVYRGRLDLQEVKQFELQNGDLERFRLMKGDILVVEGNGSASEIGRCAVWNDEIRDCVHQNHIIRCRPFCLDVTPFVALYLNSPKGIEVMKNLAITSSGLFSLSVGKIRAILIPLPPLAEQQRIVTKVEELMALCDQLETQLTATQTESRRLLEATLCQALAPALEHAV